MGPSAAINLNTEGSLDSVLGGYWTTTSKYNLQFFPCCFLLPSHFFFNLVGRRETNICRISTMRLNSLVDSEK